jgi:hypothetical protein
VKRLLETLRLFAFALSVAIVLAFVALVAAERSGWLRSRLQRELADRTGEPVKLDAVQLSFLGRSVVLRGLGIDTEDGALRIDEVVARLGREGLTPTLERVELRGGHVVLGPHRYRQPREALCRASWVASLNYRRARAKNARLVSIR